jgi:proteasome lid subunit RPN8/RPN11
LARASARRVNSRTKCEQCWALIGQHRGPIWFARRLGRWTGQPDRVEFDAAAVLRREEQRRDVVGFLHTHPHCAARPSQRDIDTMRAWVSAFGKPLVCLIEGTDGLAGFRFDDDVSSGSPLWLVQAFARGILIGVDDDGR